MKQFSITWDAIYEGFWYSEVVNEKELADRLSDKTIKITEIYEVFPEDME